MAPNDVAWITTSQMIEVDRVMMQDLGIDLIQMMENAGRLLARLAVDLYEPESVAVYAGTGGNGGGGLVAARHLANWGVAVTVVLARPRDSFGGVPRHQLDTLRRMGVAIGEAATEADLAIDALVGYSLAGAPRGPLAELIRGLGAHAGPVLALDVPTGLDATTGDTPGAAVRADATLTLALPKVGLRTGQHVGRLFVGDISVPPGVYRDLGVDGEAPPFAQGPVVEVGASASR